MNKVAIIHVENTENIVEFADFLSNAGWTLVSANETEELLKKNKIPVVHEAALVVDNLHLSDNTKLIQQILNSKLPDERSPVHFADQYNSGVQILCMNIQPLLRKLENSKKTPSLIRPNNFYIASLIRSSFVNYENLLILCDPADYKEAMIQLRTDNIDSDFRLYLAAKALNMVSAYDSGIAAPILMGPKATKDFANYLMFPFQKESVLKGGSNPQQASCLYRFPTSDGSVGAYTKLQGKELDYNITSDIAMAWEQISALYFTLKNQFSVKSTNSDGYDFTTQFTPLTETVFTIGVKLNTIVGAALSTSVVDSFRKTYTYDKRNIKNVILASSAVIDDVAAREIINCDFAAIVAPGYTTEAKQIFSENKGLRLIQTSRTYLTPYTMSYINGGLLIQTKDNKLFDHWYVKTKNRPSQYQTDQMAFGMLLVAGSRSYSAAIINDNSISGIARCATSPSIAIEDAYYEAKRSLKRNNAPEGTKLGNILVCDSAFPFCDVVKDIIDGGITAIIQTGGTNTDNELIEYCNEHDVVMVFTQTTHISY